MGHKTAVIIATEGLTTRLLYESLSNDFEIRRVIIEEREMRSKIIKRRIKKIGFFKTMGQISFLIFMTPFLSSKKRINEIIQESGLTGSKFSAPIVDNIQNVNSSELIELILKYEPDLIFINGTRIISRPTLDRISAPVINIHVGITPKYRGIHGGYWALFFEDVNLFGTTVHLVDQGIDTGEIIAQSIIKASKQDNYKTYPILQFCEGLKLIKGKVNDFNKGDFATILSITNESKLHYHPGFFQYLFKRIGKGIK